MTHPQLVIAIDGPSGVGKTTVAREVARRLDLPYLETGAMYRAIGLQALAADVDLDDEEAVAAVAATLDLSIELGEDRQLRILLDGVEPGERLRDPEVSEATSRIAVHSAVRRRMVALQRELASRWGGVVEGRDIGTRVFPETPHKFFLTAADTVRLDRRARQLADAGRPVERRQIEAEVRHRDERDSRRAESPLTWDETYTVIDTGAVTVEEVVDRIVRAVRDEERGTRSEERARPPTP